jgi:DNA-binding NarL/FixJ family response regulator
MRVLVVGDEAARLLPALSANGIDAETKAEGRADVVIVAVSSLAEDAMRSAIDSARHADEDARVIIVATDGSLDPRRALDAGAAAVVWESQVEAALAATARAVAAGQLALPADTRRPIARPALTAREKQVLALLVLGFSNREIADKLFLTESTVKTHLAATFKKLGVTSRKDAVDRILDPRHGLGTGILSITDAEPIDTA